MSGQMIVRTVSTLSKAWMPVPASASPMKSVFAKLANPSEPVKEVLAQTKVDALLSARGSSTRTAEAGVARTAMQFIKGRITFGVLNLGDAGPLSCRLIGNPELLASGQFTAAECRKVRCPDTALAVGLGALGTDFAECQGRFGEFLAAAGAVAYLPTDGTRVPDYVLAAGSSVPELQVCYAAVCEGRLDRLVRFEADREEGPIPLTEMLQGLLDVAKAERIGLVMLAEVASLMGAALRKSPALGPAEPLAYPQIREWFTFTAERAYPRSLALVVGVAARKDSSPLARFVRPLGDGVVGHIHAAAFSYRPLPRGEIELKSSVASLFESLTFQGILHLLADRRPLVGLGESEFLRGACWYGPIGDVTEERS